ncbi:MAG: hypothetical protein JXC32_00880 [Anaerolineae bacterium]|nr:hypothetical protein [Anaerolineae bacterium]
MVLIVVLAAVAGTALLVTQPSPAARFDAERARVADAARQTSLARYYLGDTMASSSRALQAEAARMSGQAEAFAAARANRQRSLAADAARYSGRAAHEAALQDARMARSASAGAARYTALARFYASKAAGRSYRSVRAEAARLTALAAQATAVGSSRQRAQAADAARYAALAAYYAARTDWAGPQLAIGPR